MAAGHHQQQPPPGAGRARRPGVTTGPGRHRTMPTDNNGAAAPVHPLELALLAVIAAALALRTLLGVLLTLAAWRPRADAPIGPVAEQMRRLPMAAAGDQPEAGAPEQQQAAAQAPAAEPAPAPRPVCPHSPSRLGAAAAADAAALAQLPMAELRAACAAAGCKPGRSRASAMAALLGAAAAAG